MSTLCTCGHYRSQHHVQEEGGKRICDYAGHSCNCTGYQPVKKEQKPNDVSPTQA